MMTFKVTYPSGLVEEVTTIDCDSVESFIAQKFGDVDPAEHGVEVSVVEMPDEDAAHEPL